MAIVINTNNASINAQRQLLRSGNDLDKSTIRLSSGKRINSASDDAAGLAIGNRMISQVRGLDQAVRNANDGASLIQVAEGALNETTNLLQRLRELAVQGSNGIYTDADRASLNAEVKQLLAQVDLIAKNTQFNGRSLLDGSAQKLDLQVGADSNQTISFQIPQLDTKTLGLGSQTGDILGAQMQVSNAGTLENAIAASAIKINGKSLPTLTTTDTVKDVIASINSNIYGVEASSLVNLSSDSVGTGILQGAQNIAISGVSLDGTSTSFTITNTTSLKDLAEKISLKTNNSIQASIGNDGKLMLSSASLSTMTIVDSTGGSASGMSPGSNPDQDIADIVNALQTSWISESEALISTYFGIEGDNYDITLNLDAVGSGGSDGVAGKVASVTWLQTGTRGTSLKLNLDMADFTPANLPNGNLVANLIYSDRVVAHEFVHAVMTRTVDMSGLPGWFREGAAEFIVGADERLKNDIQNGLLNDQTAFTNAYTAAAGPNPAALGYSVGYLAVKMMHAEIVNAGGAGISEVFDQLEAGSSLSVALATVSSAHGMGGLWNSLATFDTHVNTVGYNFMTGVYLPGVQNLQAWNTAELDTGSVAGSDFGGAARTNASMLPDSANLPPQHFNLIVPSQYGGGSKSADAQLILRSTTGDKIVVSKGVSGTDANLKSLGFVELDNNLVLGQNLNSTSQALALAVGDVYINEIDIGATLSVNGLQGKVDAINAKADLTGVVASSLAKFAVTTSSVAHKEYKATALTNVLVNDVIGINGVGIAVTAGQTMQTVAANINAAYSATGAKAYVDEGGYIHFYSDSPLNFSHANTSAPSAGFFNDIGLSVDNTSSGSLNIKGIQVALTDIYSKTAIVSEVNAVQAQTGVSAMVNDNGQLEFRSANTFSIKIGNTNGLKSFSALGISSGFSASGFDLSDTDSDKILTDESVTTYARLQLESQTGGPIKIKLTSNGANATGLLEQNQGGETAFGASLSSLNVLSLANAQKAVKVVDQALTKVSQVRSDLGAVNNRLDFTIANLNSISEKTTAALSRIVDTDFAAETAKLSRSAVLQQAAQAMLAQANQRPQQVLMLLR